MSASTEGQSSVSGDSAASVPNAAATSSPNQTDIDVGQLSSTNVFAFGLQASYSGFEGETGGVNTPSTVAAVVPSDWQSSASGSAVVDTTSTSADGANGGESAALAGIPASTNAALEQLVSLDTAGTVVGSVTAGVGMPQGGMMSTGFAGHVNPNGVDPYMYLSNLNMQGGMAPLSAHAAYMSLPNNIVPNVNFLSGSAAQPNGPFASNAPGMNGYGMNGSHEHGAGPHPHGPHGPHPHHHGGHGAHGGHHHGGHHHHHHPRGGRNHQFNASHHPHHHPMHNPMHHPGHQQHPHPHHGPHLVHGPHGGAIPLTISNNTVNGVSICKFFIQGQCARGEQCNFAHILPSKGHHMMMPRQHRQRMHRNNGGNNNNREQQDRERTERDGSATNAANTTAQNPSTSPTAAAQSPASTGAVPAAGAAAAAAATTTPAAAAAAGATPATAAATGAATTTTPADGTTAATATTPSGAPTATAGTQPQKNYQRGPRNQMPRGMRNGGYGNMNHPRGMGYNGYGGPMRGMRMPHHPHPHHHHMGGPMGGPYPPEAMMGMGGAENNGGLLGLSPLGKDGAFDPANAVPGSAASLLNTLGGDPMNPLGVLPPYGHPMAGLPHPGSMPLMNMPPLDASGMPTGPPGPGPDRNPADLPYGEMQAAGVLPVPPPYATSPLSDFLSKFTANSSVEELTGNIYLIAKDQYGCRLLQRMIDEGKPMICELTFNEVFEHMNELMTDSFGNYLCQKLIEQCTEQQRFAIIQKVCPDLVSISLNMHGTRAVQKLVETVSTPKEVELVINALRTNVVTLIKDLNGNHVIQRCLHHLSSKDNQFIYDAVSRQCVSVATHKHGCCVLQRTIDYASLPQKRQLVQEIIANALELVQDAFGNYVVQYILELGEPPIAHGIMQNLLGNISSLSVQKFSSNVVEKVLELSNDKMRAKLIEELINPERLPRLLQDPFANYVIQKALSVSKKQQFERLVAVIKPHLIALRNTAFGKRIQNKILRKFPDLNLSFDALAESAAGDMNPLVIGAMVSGLNTGKGRANHLVHASQPVVKNAGNNAASGSSGSPTNGDDDAVDENNGDGAENDEDGEAAGVEADEHDDLAAADEEEVVGSVAPIGGMSINGVDALGFLDAAESGKGATVAASAEGSAATAQAQ